MSMVCGLDLHRQQITFDAVETQSGGVWRGRVWQPDRERFRRWLRHDVTRLVAAAWTMRSRASTVGVLSRRRTRRAKPAPPVR
jgi:hypothetical protein